MSWMVRAVVLLSGGLDSTVTLGHAISEGRDVIPLTITYGQRHEREMMAAKDVVRFYGLDNHVLMDLDLSQLRSSSLISRDMEIPEGGTGEPGIPSTYVPARNMIFLSIASALAESESAEEVHIGANAVDYSGYPDCRFEFIDAFNQMIRLGTKAGVEGRPVVIRSPLVHLSKAQIVTLGSRLGVPMHLTWSCYKGGERACGRCDSCLLRLKGFREAGLTDIIEYEVSE